MLTTFQSLRLFLWVPLGMEPKLGLLRASSIFLFHGPSLYRQDQMGGTLCELLLAILRYDPFCFTPSHVLLILVVWPSIYTHSVTEHRLAVNIASKASRAPWLSFEWPGAGAAGGAAEQALGGAEVCGVWGDATHDVGKTTKVQKNGEPKSPSERTPGSSERRPL